MTAPNPKFDQLSDLSRQLVDQAGALALETNDRIQTGTFDYAKWAKSMLNLWDLGLSGSLALGPDMFAPCFSCPPSSDDADYSEYLTAPERPVARKVSVVPGSFKHDGSPLCVIPDHRIHIDPLVLPAYATRFRVAVSWPDLRSGTYRGYVRVVPEMASTVVVDDVVPVIIDL